MRNYDFQFVAGFFIKKMRAKEYFKNEVHYVNWSMLMCEKLNIVSELATKENFQILSKTLYTETLKRTPAEYVSYKMSYENKLPDDFKDIIDKLNGNHIVSVPAEIIEIRPKKHKPIKEFSNEFILLVNKVNERSGVYFIYDINNTLIYIGRSRNLGTRIQTSSVEKCDGVFIKILILDNEANTNILESYYISKLKPILNNKHDKTEYFPSFEINHDGELTTTIKIYK